MDLNYLLLWLVSFSCIVFTIQISRFPRSQSLGWMVVSASVLAFTGIAYYFSPTQAGWIGSLVWSLFVVLPLLTFKQIDRLVAQERYAQARWIASCIRWLHPADGWFQHPALLRALEMAQQGEIERAKLLLNRYRSNSTPIGRSAMAFLYRMGANWQELLLWLQHNFSEKTLLEDASLVSFYVRALGELGDLNGLLQALEQAERKLEQAGSSRTLNLLRMFALAFGGQPQPVQYLFDTSLSQYSLSIRQFWLATAELAAGNEAVGRQQLEMLQHRGNAGLNRAIAWRLSRPPLVPNRILTDRSKQILSRIPNVLDREARNKRTLFSNQTAYATYGLIAINLLVFGFEVALGGSQNPHVLAHMGALAPGLVIDFGQWHLLLTSIFLHAGALHLSMNMMGLYFFGNIVENALGRGRYLLLYFISGIGSMLTLVGLVAINHLPVQITVVGASGAIMGLLGAIGAILLWDWRRHKSRVAAKRLRTVLFIVVLQTVFDLVTPQVSLESHLSGLIIGFLFSNLLLWVWPKKMNPA